MSGFYFGLPGEIRKEKLSIFPIRPFNIRKIELNRLGSHPVLGGFRGKIWIEKTNSFEVVFFDALRDEGVELLHPM